MKLEIVNKKQGLKIIYFIVLFIIGIIIGSIFSSKIPYIGDVNIKELERKNKELKENIINRNDSINYIKGEYKKIKSENNVLKNTVTKLDSSLTKIEADIDSMDHIVIKQDSIMIKLYEDKYKDINNIPNMDIDERVEFFTDYFSIYR